MFCVLISGLFLLGVWMFGCVVYMDWFDVLYYQCVVDFVEGVEYYCMGGIFVGQGDVFGVCVQCVVYL